VPWHPGRRVPGASVDQREVAFYHDSIVARSPRLLSDNQIIIALATIVGLGVIGGFINVLAKHTFARQRRRGGASEEKEGEGEAKEDAPSS